MSSTKLDRLSLFEVRASLDRLALELLRGRFPHLDVEPYCKVSEAYIREVLRRDERYRRNMRGDPLEALILLSMDKVASAYVLITGKRGRWRVKGLLRDYEAMVGDYLESKGISHI